jgi:hypothetical protein
VCDNRQADQSGRAVQAMNCLRPLQSWDLWFEYHLRHWCLCVRIFCVCAGSGLTSGCSPSKESYWLCVKDQGTETRPGSSKWLYSHREIENGVWIKWMDLLTTCIHHNLLHFTDHRHTQTSVLSRLPSPLAVFWQQLLPREILQLPTLRSSCHGRPCRTLVNWQLN